MYEDGKGINKYDILKVMKQKLENCTWPFQCRRLPWLLLLPLGFLLPQIAPSFPWAAEWYARQIYPVVSSILSLISAIFPFSLAEILIYALLGSLAVILLAYIGLCIARRIPLIKLISLLITLGIAAGALLNAFYFLWGFNYFRPSLYTLLQLPVQERPSEELALLCQELTVEAIALRQQVSEDEEGVFMLAEGWPAMAEKIPEAYKQLGQEISFLSQEAKPAKGVLASEAMSWAGIAGIYIPFTAEANVNIHQPALLIPSSAAHETAHYLGIAREDEANFLAYLSCSISDAPSISYSGTMLALIYCMNALYETDLEAFAIISSEYSEGMWRDLLDYSAYWAAYEGEVEMIVSSVNDGYLRMNQQEDGVKSYGLMVDLLLAWRYR